MESFPLPASFYPFASSFSLIKMKLWRTMKRKDFGKWENKISFVLTEVSGHFYWKNILLIDKYQCVFPMGWLLYSCWLFLLFTVSVSIFALSLLFSNHTTCFSQLPPPLCHSSPLHISHSPLYIFTLSPLFPYFPLLPPSRFQNLSRPSFSPSLPQTHQCFYESRLVYPLVSVIFMSTVPLKYLQ